MTRDREGLDWGKPYGVISVYNDSPEYLYSFFSGVSLFDNSDIDHTWPSPRGNHMLEKRQNVGHSLSNFLDWIVTHWDDMPDRVAFVKSNVCPRHIDLHSLQKMLLRRSLSMLWSKGGPVGPHFQETQLHPNFYLERNNSWYMRQGQTPEFFGSFNDLLEFIYDDPQPRKFIAFSPGACYLATRGDIQNAPKELYRFLSQLASYKFFPPEAYLVERILWTVFSSSESVNVRFESDAWEQDLNLRRGKIADSRSVNFLRRAGAALEDFGCRLQSRESASLEFS